MIFYIGLWTFMMTSKVKNVQSLPIQSGDQVNALYYLIQYGYIPENTNSSPLLGQDGLKEYIKAFQTFAGIEATGELNEETVELMNTPRCGVKDIVGLGTSARRRRKRYALQGSRWKTRQLTYRITRYPSSSTLSTSEIDRQMRMAFDLWEKETPLTFLAKSSGSVHIEIRFESREHGDGDPFDGIGGTLAHAFFPQFGGDAHFDDEEYWTIEEFRGTNLLQTAAHELGHSLGLSHSDVNSALMAPFYRGWIPNLKLDQDDVDAIQALYGPDENRSGFDVEEEEQVDNGVETTSPKIDVNNDDVNELCIDSKIDAMVDLSNGNFYVFKGSKYWKLNDDSVAPGYPRSIGQDWGGLPDNLDAAVTWTANEMTYFFKGSMYWKFHNRVPQPGYPKLISEGFTGIPDNVDAAFVWGGNGKIYFFKGGDYYRFDPDRKPPVSSLYPKPKSNWGLRDEDLDAAIRWKNGYTYFFSNGMYERFNDRKFSMDEGDPAFPRDTGSWWFGCRREDESRVFFTSGLDQNPGEEKVLPLFEEEGDQSLDVLAGDE